MGSSELWPPRLDPASVPGAEAREFSLGPKNAGTICLVCWSVNDAGYSDLLAKEMRSPLRLSHLASSETNCECVPYTIGATQAITSDHLRFQWPISIPIFKRGDSQWLQTTIRNSSDHRQLFTL